MTTFNDRIKQAESGGRRYGRDGSNAVTPTASGSAGGDMPTVRVLRHFGGLRRDVLVVHPSSATAEVYVYKIPVGGI